MLDTQTNFDEAIEGSIKSILTRVFRLTPDKQEANHLGKRINFSCPYCGDSKKNTRRKRGNYYPSYSLYKCYNCGIIKNGETFLKDFKELDFLEPEHLIELKNRTKEASESKKAFNNTTVSNFLGADFSKILIPREEFMIKMDLIEVTERSAPGVYLTKRSQKLGKKFAWDEKKKNLFIFNLDAVGDHIFGLQIRYGSFSKKSNYLTYPLSSIYSNLLKIEDTDPIFDIVMEVDHLSTLFGLLSVSFMNPITVFEGPLDHFLYKNSIALCSAANHWPFDIKVRYLFDNDKTGRDCSIAKICDQEEVFLWRKFFDENEELKKYKIKDLNDIVEKCIMNKIKIKSLDQYFSDSKHDIIYI